MGFNLVFKGLKILLFQITTGIHIHFRNCCLHLTELDEVGHCLLSSQRRVAAFIIEHQQDIQEGFNTETLPLSLDRPTQEQGF